MACAACSMNFCGFSPEVVEPGPAINEYANKAAPRKLCAVLKLSEYIRQFDGVFLERYCLRPGDFGRLHACLADAEAGLAPLQSGFGDRRFVA